MASETTLGTTIKLEKKKWSWIHYSSLWLYAQNIFSMAFYFYVNTVIFTSELFGDSILFADEEKALQLRKIFKIYFYPNPIHGLCSILDDRRIYNVIFLFSWYLVFCFDLILLLPAKKERIYKYITFSIFSFLLSSFFFSFLNS